jgi:hypothetical protein
MQSQYKVIANRDYEVVYTDGEFLSKCCMLIFKDHNKKKYVYTQDGLTNRFCAYRKMTPSSFSSIPVMPKTLPVELHIETKEDMRKLINQGYEIYAFTSAKQYGKVLADYFIENKDLYQITKTDEELYNEFVYVPRCEHTGSPAEDTHNKVTDDMLNAVEYWEANKDKMPKQVKYKDMKIDIFGDKLKDVEWME